MNGSERKVAAMFNKVILIVDDEAHMLTLLELTLKRHGYIVMKTQNPYTALDLIQSLTPNLFILDIMMPEMNGLDLCEHIRARASTADTPIIILSARSDPKTKALALQAGADVFLTKSTLPNGLLNELQRLLV
jgi:two-component system alkaline phosphatase synthesis response regulator PhoP